MTDTTDLQESIYQEIRSKIKEDDIQAPQRNGPFFYYSKNLTGEQYVVHCRRMAPGGEGPGHVDEVMETGSGAPEEEVLLDENKEAGEHEFYHVGEVKVNLWLSLLFLDFAVIFGALGQVKLYHMPFALDRSLAWPRLLFLKAQVSFLPMIGVCISGVSLFKTCSMYP